jgi:membrane protein
METKSPRTEKLVSRVSPPLRFWYRFKRAWVGAYETNAFGTAKAAAYSALLAFFPMLTSITAILVQANADSVSSILTRVIFEAVPPGTQEMIRANLILGGSRPVFLLITGTGVSLFAASGLMITLMDGFNSAYRIPQGRSFWHQRAVAVLLVATAALPLVIVSSLMVFGQRIEDVVLHWIGVLDEGERLKGGILFLGLMIRYLVSMAAIVLSLASLYYLGPEHPDGRRHNVWPGAMTATVLWFFATIGFTWYVRNIANYNVMYGSIAAVIALIVWMYVLSIIALVGCSYNAERERSKTLPAAV